MSAVIVSGYGDLLVLHPFENIQIVTAAVFLRMLGYPDRA